MLLDFPDNNTSAMFVPYHNQGVSQGVVEALLLGTFKCRLDGAMQGSILHRLLGDGTCGPNTIEHLSSCFILSMCLNPIDSGKT